MENKHTFSLLHIIRQAKRNKEGDVPVYLKITCDGVRSEVSVKILVSPDKWSPAKGRLNGTTEETKRLNNCIEVFEHRAREILTNIYWQARLLLPTISKMN